MVFITPYIHLTLYLIKFIIYKWAGNVAQGTGEVHLGMDLMERDDLKDVGVDVRIILKCIFKTWTGMIWLKIWTGGGFL